MLKRTSRISILSLVLLAPAALGFAAADLAETTSSPDVTITVDGGTLVVNDEDAVIEDGAPPALTDLGALPGATDLQAYHLRDSGDQLFVLDTTATVGIVTAEPRDVVVYDGSSYSIAFDGSAQGVPDGSRVDAVTENEDGDLILSFDTTVDLGGGVVADDEDLVLFDSVGGASLLLDASAAGIDGALDLDGAHYIRASQNLLVSFDTSGTVAAVTFDDEDVLEYDDDSGSWELSVDAATAEPDWLAADLSALHAVRSCASLNGDTDADLLCDDEDPCPIFANGLPIVDSNGDGIPNECQCGDANGDGELQFADAFQIAICAGPGGNCTADPSLADTDNNGQLQNGDAFLLASTVNPGGPPAYLLTCARRPSGAPPPPGP